MAYLASNRASVVEDVSLANKIDLRSNDKVCWADLVDDRTTDPGDSPRSVTSSRPDICVTQAPLERTLWADMEDSDSESSDETLDTAVESAVAPSSFRPSQFPQAFRTIVRGGGGTTQDELDGSAERRQKPESKNHLRSDIDNHEMPSSVRRGKGGVKNIGKGAGKVGGESLDRRTAKKGAGKGGKKGAGKGVATEKYQCQFILGIEEDSKFRVVRRVLGTSGANMKRIAGESGAKLRLRGQGSKFLEGPEQKESDDDLMLCVSCLDANGFETAKRAVSELIEGIHHDYSEFCRKAGHACPELELKIHEGYRAGSR